MDKIPYLPPAVDFLDTLAEIEAARCSVRDMMNKQIVDALVHGMSVRVMHPDGTSELIEPKAFWRPAMTQDDPDLAARPFQFRHSNAEIDVLQERRRQVKEEGWTPEHDDQHGAGELAAAAASYALHAGDTKPRGFAPAWWPWDVKWWKPRDRRRDLVKAAALLLAEIERLDRHEERG